LDFKQIIALRETASGEGDNNLTQNRKPEWLKDN